MYYESNNINDYRPQIIDIKAGKQTSYLVIGIILFFILAVCCVLMYYTCVYFKQTNINSNVVGACQPGQCSTIIATGEKNCPINPGDFVLYDPTIQTCNTQYGCEDSRTPYALQTDGSVNIFGACEQGIECRCLSNPTCPQDILVLFNMVNGTIYQENPDTSRFTFQQISMLNDAGTIGSYSNPSSQFCTIKANHLDRVSPSACIFADHNDITIDELETCMNEVNSCVQGQIAFYPNNFDNFILNDQNLNAIYNIPVGCVQISNQVHDGHITKYCPYGSIPVYNKMIGKIVCNSTRSD